MVNSDILLDDEGIEMIPADGAVDVTAGPDETAGIRLDPATALLHLGGGTSDAYSDGHTFGNILLDSADSAPRIELSAGETAPTDGAANAVFISSHGTEEAGRIGLGRVGDSFDDSTISLDAANSQVTLGGQTGSGELLLYREGLVETVTVDGGTGRMALGGPGQNGTLSLQDGAGSTIDLDATAGVAGLGQTGGKLRLELDPGGGLFSVLDGDGDPVFQVDADGGVTFGSGDGKVGMDLDPENGLFSIVDADGDPVFQIDTQAETVNTAKGYSRGTIDGKP